MIQDETSNATGCGQSVFMQVPLIRGIVEYGVLWTNINPGATPWLFTASGGRSGTGSGPYGEEYYSTKQVESPGGTIYKVPHGYGAWFVSAGGGPAPCDFRASSAVAWGWTARYAVTGTVTIAGGEGPAPDVRMQANCPSGGTTTTDAGGNYEFLLDRGPCTIKVEPKPGEKVHPKQRVLNVTHDFHNVDFQLELPLLYYKVETGLSVGVRTPGGNKLIKAGTNFTERVTFKNRSFTKTIVVAPVFPTVSGNVEGGSLQPVGGTVQRQVSDLSVTDPSQFVLLHPREKKVYDAVFATVASNSLGYYAGTKPASAGTRGYIQFPVPVARIVEPGDEA